MARAPKAVMTQPAIAPRGAVILTVDVGGSHLKIKLNSGDEVRRVVSGPELSGAAMVDKVRDLAKGWSYDFVTIGYPGPIVDNLPALEPANLGAGWKGYDFASHFTKPVKMVNDALMQAIGSYEGGRMLFLGLGTGLGAAMVLDNVGQPMELAHLPYKKGKTFEDYVGERGLEGRGKKKWREAVADVVARLRAALRPEYIVLGGGNVDKLQELPEACRRGDNANAFKGGFRLWTDAKLIV